MNKIHFIHILICFIYLKIIESGIFMSGMPTVCEDTDGCAKQYMCALGIYLMTVLSSSYVIIIYREINVPGHWESVVDGLNATYKCYLMEEMENIGKLGTNDTINFGMISSA